MIRELVHVNINVTDIARSIEFYRKLGFEIMHSFGELPERGRPPRGMKTGDGEVCGAVMSLGDRPRQAMKIELLQWLGDDSPEVQENLPKKGARELGVARIAMRTVELLDFVEELKTKGIQFELEPVEIDVVGARRFALFRDPDETLLELVEF